MQVSVCREPGLSFPLNRALSRTRLRALVEAGPVPDNRVPRSGSDPLAKMTTKPRRRLALVVLAAGKGKRMRSASQKVLTPVCGKPALWHVLHTARAVRPDRIVVVVGKQS